MPNLSTVTDAPCDECFRCGYDLRGIANDRPCPECGLAAERSRRVTDELHETRPKWLRSLAAGASLVLLSIVLTAAWPSFAGTISSALSEWLWARLVFSGFGATAIILIAGIWLLARPEGYPTADTADRWLRRWLRLAALVPLVTIGLVGSAFRWAPFGSPAIPAILIAGAAATAPLPWLLFRRLRGLAKRARSAHLAEHCTIVGIGATAAALCMAAEALLTTYGEKLAQTLGLRPNWETNSTTSLILVLIFILTICLFLLWSLYLLVRFTIAFIRAARQASRKWRRDDHSRPIT